MKIPSNDIEVCRRIGKMGNDAESRKIFKRLRNLNSKQNIYKNKKLFNGTVIREDLTPRRLELMAKAVIIHEIGMD